MLYPPRCVLCDGLLETGELEKGIHKECESKLLWVQEPSCMQCGCPLTKEEQEYCYDCAKKKMRQLYVPCIQQGKAVFLYRDEVKKAMYRLKYANRREYATFFARTAYDRCGDWISQKGIEAVIAVPMYGKKQKKRGYNQAELIAKKLAEYVGVPYLGKSVLRVRDTKAQKELSEKERKNNLKNAFQMQKNIVQCKSILLVDDIYTTGNTVEAVAEELYRAGINRVYTLAVCIGEGI